MADATDDPIAASQRLQNNLQKLIDEVEAEEQQDKEMSDTQVALRRYGLTRENCHGVKTNTPGKIGLDAVCSLTLCLFVGAQDLKAQGNESFKLRNFPDAIRKYTGSLDILNQLDGRSNSPSQCMLAEPAVHFESGCSTFR